MNAKQAHREAAAQSKPLGQSRFVVYVFDQGYDVYDAGQCTTWAPLINVEAAYVAGVQVSTPISEVA